MEGGKGWGKGEGRRETKGRKVIEGGEKGMKERDRGRGREGREEEKEGGGE